MFALDQLAMEPASLRKTFPKIRDISFHKIYLIYYFNFREECSSRSGTNEGSCASGFGVCCVREYFQRTKCEIPERHKTWFFIILVTLSCGESSSENNTYIVQSSTTSAPATPCTYKICPCSTDICRIRYDFTTNVLANQVTSSADAASGTAPDLTTSQLKMSIVWKSLKNHLKNWIGIQSLIANQKYVFWNYDTSSQCRVCCMYSIMYWKMWL